MTKYVDAPPDPAQLRLTGKCRNTPPAKAMVSYSTPRQAGFFEHIVLRPGFELTLVNQPSSPGLRLDFEIDRAPVDFSYNLSQRVRCTMSHSGTKGKKVMERKPGEGVMACLPGTRGFVETPPGEPVVGVSLHFSLQVFKELVRAVPHCLGELGLNGSGRIENRPFYLQSPCSTDTLRVLGQIIDCPYHNETRRLFLEAKSLELVALKLADMSPCRYSAMPELSHRDLDLVREAHHILVSRMAHPPSLSDLSRLVGINRNKLNLGFKQLYGETVFAVLRNARLAEAQRLIRDNELSLSEIAYSVGYNNQANFTTAFRKHFGKTPKSARREEMPSPAMEETTSC